MSVPIKPAATFYCFDDVVIDCDGFTVFKCGEIRALPPRAFDVLRYLIANRDRVVEKAELFEYVWTEKFVTDNALTRTIADIRHALGDCAESPRYIHTVPKRGYRFIAALKIPNPQDSADIRVETAVAVKIPLTEECQTGGDKVVTRQANARRPFLTKRRALALSVIIVFVLAFGVLGTHLLTEERDSQESIAVMPFVNLSGNPDWEYLADGLTDSTISNLSRISRLKVMSRNSVFRYKGHEVDPLAVGRELGVRTVLLSRVETVGDRLSVNLELVDAQDNRHIWGGRFSRRLADMVELQAEIARNVSDNLQLSLTPDEKALVARSQTDNAEAYQLYLKGRYRLETMDRRDIDKSLSYFQNAIKLDPNYALAYVGMAEYYFGLGNQSGNRPRDYIPLAKAAAERAIELDETLAEAHATMGSILELYERDWAGGEKEIQRARELNPDADLVRRSYISHLAVQGRHEESLKESHRALALSPLNVRLNVYVGANLFGMKRYDEAIQWFQKLIESEIYVTGSYGWLAQLYEAKGLYDKAIEADIRFRTLGGDRPGSISALRVAYVSGGWKGYWQTALEQRKSIAYRGYVEPFVFAAIYARLGNKGQALRWLEISRDEHSIFVNRIVYDPKFDSLRSDPRFQELVRQVSPAHSG